MRVYRLIQRLWKNDQQALIQIYCPVTKTFEPVSASKVRFGDGAFEVHLFTKGNDNYNMLETDMSIPVARPKVRAN